MASAQRTDGRGRQRACAALAVAVVAALLASAPAAAAERGSAATAAVPAGFSDVRLPAPAGHPLEAPTTIAPLPGGRALILEQAGAVRVLSASGTLLAASALTLAVCSRGELGLLGAAADPAFATNGYVYLYYTHPAGDCESGTGRYNRVSRFTMTGDSIDPGSELVLLDRIGAPAGNNNGGDLHFGPDGDLYVSVGDGGTSPRGGRASAAQDLSLLNGKILRITTTPGVVPPGNPLASAPGAVSCWNTGTSAPSTGTCTQIYAYGLRNPFRFAFDPNAAGARFFVDDVGDSTWEEVDAGGAGLDYGWDAREGACVAGSSTDCPPAPGGVTDPLTVYDHASGCTFITAAAFIPDGLWPSRYDGGYLFGDGGCGRVFLLTRAGTVDYAQPFARTTGITDMAFLTQRGATALYYVANATGELHRIAARAQVAPARCRIADVRGLLATTARVRIATGHCTPRTVVVALRNGVPLRRGHALVRASSAARPGRSPGAGRRWTLRVEQVLQKLGAMLAARSPETIYVGWEATPSALAANPGARFR